VHTMTDRPDSELLEAAREGGAVAFSALYSRHRPAMQALARHLGGPCLADDLVAESVMKIWLKLQQGDGPRTDFLGYARITIRNTYFTEARRAQRVSLIGDSEDLVQVTDGATSAAMPSTEASVLLKLDQGRVRRAIEGLPPRWRHVLVRIYLDDAPWDQVAGELGLQLNATHQLAFRARRGLRLSLATPHTDGDVSAA
jgi:RNA polymerase sigma factor (sigma-70 family)